MKLDSSTPNIPQPGVQKTTAPASATANDANTTAWAAAAAVSNSAPTRGNVHLSPMSAQLMAAASDSSNDVDMAKVAELREAIANGTLRIDPSRIADGLINTAQELIKAPT